jgi:SAM-dependent methyltransferase
LSTDKRHLSLSRQIEAKFEEHGDTPRGLDWPNAEDLETRYRVMLEVIREHPQEQTVDLLDIGCGTSGLFRHLREHELAGQIQYSGLDVSERLISVSRAKFPEATYYHRDILEVTPGEELAYFDYAVINGIFTVKYSLSFEEMFAFFRAAVVKAFAIARRGIAFNTMSKHVDWERDDLFHMPFDLLADFLTSELSRNFVFRNDYGLYEYTTYVYH